MRTLKNNTIIFDQECPMCDLYTGFFIRSGMLDNNGRIPYNQLPFELKSMVDMNKARNEIALVNISTGAVTYGPDSLFAIIQYRMPFLKILFANVIFRFLILKLYRLISYNRRVIVGGKQFQSEGSCVPDVNVKYRIAYLFMATIVSACIHASFMPLLRVGFKIPEMFPALLVMHLAQLFSLGIIAAVIARRKVLHYLGQISTVSLIGSLALLPAIVLNKFMLIPGTFYTWYFVFASILMLSLLIKRIQLLHMHYGMVAAWSLVHALLLLVWLAQY